MQVEVFNSLRTGPIYTTQIDIFYNEALDTYDVVYRNRVRGRASVEMLAIDEFAQFLLNGFEQPGVYRAEASGDVLAIREVL